MIDLLYRALRALLQLDPPAGGWLEDREETALVACGQDRFRVAALRDQRRAG